MAQPKGDSHVERTRIYPTLAAALTKRGFDPATIEKYGQLWDSITAADRLLCPFCYTYTHQGKRSALKALPEEAGTMRCESCNTVFYSPLPA
jgi:hypothetical protein